MALERLIVHGGAGDQSSGFVRRGPMTPRRVDARNFAGTNPVRPLRSGWHGHSAAAFSGFLKIGLLGFGGVAPIARHVIVEDRAWLTEEEYAAIMGIGQVLPGANTINAAVMIGDRFQGIAGAIVCLVSLMAMPLVIVTGLGVLYHRFAALPQVQAAISGSAAAAAGLVIGAALKMARRLHPTAIAIVFGLLAFVAVRACSDSR